MNSELDTAGLQANAKVSFEDAWGFILKVGVAAHGYGSTATRLESFLKDLSQRIGYQGVFRSGRSCFFLCSL